MIRLFARLFVLVTLVVVATLIGVLVKAGEMREAHAFGASVTEPVEVAIVLASSVDPDLFLGYSTRRRVDAAIALYKDGKAGKLLMSGGVARGTQTSLASLMRSYALERGVPAEDILTENRSRTTLENIRFSFEIAYREGLTRRAIVTDDFHLYRASQLARAFGTASPALVAARGLEFQGLTIRIPGYLRETMAWWYNVGKVGAWFGGKLIGLSDETLGARIY